jgi:hypothetical protein
MFEDLPIEKPSPILEPFFLGKIIQYSIEILFELWREFINQPSGRFHCAHVTDQPHEKKCIACLLATETVIQLLVQINRETGPTGG